MSTTTTTTTRDRGDRYGPMEWAQSGGTDIDNNVCMSAYTARERDIVWKQVFCEVS